MLNCKRGLCKSFKSFYKLQLQLQLQNFKGVVSLYVIEIPLDLYKL